MSPQIKRNIFAIQNKYQMQVLFLIIAPLFVITFAFLICTYLMSQHISRFVESQSYFLIGSYVAQWFYAMVCFVIITLVTFLLLAFKIAYDLVNPFDRINLEVDEFLITGVKRTLVVRPEDELANEVSQRYNKLITRI